MANSSGLNRAGALRRVTVAAITAALVSTTTAAVAAEPGATFNAPAAAQPARASVTAAATTAASGAALNNLYGWHTNGDVIGYTPVGGGAIQRIAGRQGWDWVGYKNFTQADTDGKPEDEGWYHADGWYAVNSAGRLHFAGGGPVRDLGGGWNAFDKVISAGNTGGAAPDDLLARDRSGVLWHYLGYGNASLTQRYRIGGGWNAYTQIAGKGDVTGDGRADLVARDRSGVLWLYKGTGDYKSPFGPRARVGGGWNMYNYLFSPGDLTGDRRADLVARDSAGALWLYKGNGSSTTPYTGRIKIGTSGWNGFGAMF
ncbi:VCBS repeat-containing protein [Streptomyces venezuelae]|uniref:FG-GAP repeat domain-containing protein n=1 Tax=Streptomyces venezuelae TaxID=54571 RepID=UPI00123BDB36|nr:VCBS repeat-containing protein [Streptomyces venezuelae]QES08950.1 VCBS repeat-containing protein [Streptomyces venezuelae]